MEKIESRIFFIFVMSLFAVSSVYGQISGREIVLKLDTLSDKLTELKSIYYPTISRAWENEADSTIIDSVLYKCKLSDVYLHVLVKPVYDKIVYKFPHYYNLFQKQDLIFSYPIDSIKKWNNGHAPRNAIIKMPCSWVMKQGKTCDMDIFFIPYFNGFRLNDKRLNDFMLSFSLLKIRSAEYKKNRFKVYIDNYLSKKQDAVKVIITDKEGNRHRNAYLNNLKYKGQYHVGDTIPLNNIGFRLDSLDKNWTYLYLSRIKSENKNVLSDAAFNKLKPYFTEGRPYLLIDFWGTWCRPCIGSLPKLKKLYDSVYDKCNFVGVCFDSPDNMEQARKIYNENGINWGLLFDNKQDINNSLTQWLRINTFPSYMLINDKKEILFGDEGEKGFVELKNRVKCLLQDY